METRLVHIALTAAVGRSYSHTQPRTGVRGRPVGVGIMIAHNPLHGSGQAALPHPALALGKDAHATQGIGMTDGRQRQPATDETPHAVPKDAAILATPRQRAIPEASYLEPKDKQRVLIHEARRSSGRVHAPLLATTCPIPGWVRACAAEAQLSPRSASPATFCVSFAATP